MSPLTTSNILISRSIWKVAIKTDTDHSVHVHTHTHTEAHAHTHSPTYQFNSPFSEQHWSPFWTILQQHEINENVIASGDETELENMQTICI